ncbi:MAG: DUF427 domain-containing protein [Deltaproteobacteria bacterium]|nr:DUF427 domain-containing protein [Deltaproteobacteria bacterium]MBM4297008.1 DUF427 domain-containing protein [Deltaproteobacteria bacterium]
MQSNVTQQRVPVHGDQGHWVHVSESPRHVRVFLGGETIASSKRAKLVREAEVLPCYYFPKEDVRTELLSLATEISECPHKGTANYYSIRAGSKVEEAGAWSYRNPSPAASAIKDHFAFVWPKMDKWMEEEEELYIHARDPYKRVDAIPSARHVRVVIDGQTVAETRRPCLVFETNHPVRYYIPQGDVRMDLLIRSATKSRCPYKGPASYWSVQLGNETFNDLVWGYLDTIPECPKIKGLVCFWHERGCDIYVDGELVAQPQNKWARPLRS